MRESESKWRKYYLQQTGEEWNEESGLDALENLNKEQRAVATVLYERYLQDKSDAATRRYETEQAEKQATAQKRAALAAYDKLKKYETETALATGRQGQGSHAEASEKRDELLAAQLHDIQEKTYERKDELTARYADKEAQLLAKTEADVNRVQAEFDVAYNKEWKELQSELNDMLADYKPQGGSKYTPQGKKLAQARVEAAQDKLGDKYEEALAWVEALPVYDEYTSGQWITTEDGKSVHLSEKAWKQAGEVTYVGGAGNAVSKLDIFKVSYRGTTYTMKGGDEVNKSMQQLLNAIAKEKNIACQTGTMVYYDGQLYVYDGVNSWLNTRTSGMKSSQTSRDRLLNRLATGWEEE